MAGNKKVIIVLGLLLAVGGFSAAEMSRQNDSAKSALSGTDKSATQTADRSGTGGLAQAPSTSATADSKGQAKDANFTYGGGEQLKTSELFYKMIFALLVVIALAVGVMYFLKRLLPKIAKFPAKQIKIVETVALGQHKSIYLIEVSGRRLLIGGTNETITRLADLSEPVEISEG
jgi:flagellar biosynthetic protein FliO